MASAGESISAEGGDPMNDWQNKVLSVPYPKLEAHNAPVLQLIRQDFEELERNRSILQTPLTIGSRVFQKGLGTHAQSLIRVHSPLPLDRFSAWIGVDHNDRTRGGQGSISFAVKVEGGEIYHSRILQGGGEPERIDLPLNGARSIDLLVDDGGDGPACDHADWAEAVIKTVDGKEFTLGELPFGESPLHSSRYPFSFFYGTGQSDDILEDWNRKQTEEKVDQDLTWITTVWNDPQSGLELTWVVTKYSDFPALDWVLTLENKGSLDTPIIRDVLALDMSNLFWEADPASPPRLHSSHGGTPDPQQFEISTAELTGQEILRLGSGNGRSSTRNFPFFKVETSQGSLVAAVGWSGTWKADFESSKGGDLRITAGLEKTHFILHPGERVRSPRILLLWWQGDTLESNSQFRQLIYKHYAAKRDGKTPLPIPFCNTCFTRGGGWLNECNAENQISLIKAYAPMGLEALITDAGWFTGGWPEGAGNWEPRKDAYPEGMGPVASAAKELGMVYGLWFEPERVVAGTDIQKNHPEWCLASRKEAEGTYLLNFGLPEVQEYFFNIVKGFMELPGFRFYRQDFNMDPLPYWRFNDSENRQGITEMKYIEGLYAYWDRIAQTWPDSIREECASGGHRIDLETVLRMHVHQTTDYWFQDEVNQAALWSLSQYLPNNVVSVPINRLDDYSFHSALASSLIPGWIADAPGFDTQRGSEILAFYHRVRHLLVGGWYPLLPYTRDPRAWIASQYHRADLDEGMILAFRHADSPYRTVDITLHGLKPETPYELTFCTGQEKESLPGRDLMKGYSLTITEPHRSEVILYRGNR